MKFVFFNLKRIIKAYEIFSEIMIHLNFPRRPHHLHHLYHYQQTTIIFIISSLILILSGQFCHAELDGPNICTKNERLSINFKIVNFYSELKNICSVPIEEEVTIPKPYEIRTVGWCLQIPPRCPKIK